MKESMYEMKIKPMQLIKMNSMGSEGKKSREELGVEAVESTLKCLEQLIENLSRKRRPEIKVISICGEFKTGKSLLINSLYSIDEGFQVFNSAFSWTAGIQMSALYNQDIHQLLILIDTEGLNNPQASNNIQYNQIILLFCSLFSDVMIFNTRGAIDETQMDNIALLASKINQLKLEKLDYMQNKECSLVWALRDWGLQWNQEDQREQNVKRKEQESHKYLQNLLSNRQYEIIKRVFKERECLTFIRPCISQPSLLNLTNNSTTNLTHFREQFLQQIQTLRQICQKFPSHKHQISSQVRQTISLINRKNHHTALSWNIVSKENQINRIAQEIKENIIGRLKKEIKKQAVGFEEMKELNKSAQKAIDGLKELGEIPLAKRKMKQLKAFYKKEIDILRKKNKQKIMKLLIRAIEKNYVELQKQVIMISQTNEAEQISAYVFTGITKIEKDFYKLLKHYLGPQSSTKARIPEPKAELLTKIVTQLLPKIINKAQQQSFNYYEQKMKSIEEQMRARNKEQMSEALKNLKISQYNALEQKHQHQNIIERMQEIYSILKAEYEQKNIQNSKLLSQIQRLNNKLSVKDALTEQKEQQINRLKQQVNKNKVQISQKQSLIDQQTKNFNQKQQQLQTVNKNAINIEKQKFIALLKEEEKKCCEIAQAKINAEKVVHQKEMQMQQLKIRTEDMLKQLELSLKQEFTSLIQHKEQQFTQQKQAYLQQLLAMKQSMHSNQNQLNSLKALLQQKQQQTLTLTHKFTSICQEHSELQSQSQQYLSQFIRDKKQYETINESIKSQLILTKQELDKERKEHENSKNIFTMIEQQKIQQIERNRRQVEESLKRKYEINLKQLQSEIYCLQSKIEDININKTNKRNRLQKYVNSQLRNIGPFYFHQCSKQIQSTKNFLINKQKQIQQLVKQLEQSKKHSQNQLLALKNSHSQQLLSLKNQLNLTIRNLQESNTTAENTTEIQKQLLNKYSIKVKQLQSLLEEKHSKREQNKNNNILQKSDQNYGIAKENQELKKQVAIQEKEIERLNKSQRNFHKTMKKLRNQNYAKEFPDKNAHDFWRKQMPTSQPPQNSIYQKNLQQKSKELQFLKDRLIEATQQSYKNEKRDKQLIVSLNEEIQQNKAKYQQELSIKSQQFSQLYQEYTKAIRKIQMMRQDSECLKEMINELKELYIREKVLNTEKNSKQLQPINLSSNIEKESQIISRKKEKFIKKEKASTKNYELVFDEIFK